ncbi:MAG: alpha/beta fold hydrolase, partial [Firmicutes bacterium]|nr:alpha/beta fold hydrolase [Bacillota bacterium]
APWCGVDPDQLVTPRLCTIHSGDGLDFTAWLYRPSPLRAKLPVVIAFHGGPEWQERPFFSALYQTLCEAGYAVLAPNVRGSTGYGKHFAALDDGRRRLDVLRDVAAVVDFVQRQPDLDARRMVAMGASYGGYLVLLTLTHLPDRFRAGIEMVGMADLEAFLERTGPWRRALREAEYGRLETDREVLRALSPIHAIDQIQVPLMVVHGANDPRVPVAEAEQIVAALKTRGQRVEYLCYGDEGHGISRLKNLYDLYPRLLRFLKEAIDT